MRYGIIYKATNVITGKTYIGRTVGTLEKRWYEHQRHESNCVYLKHAINKYGVKSFRVEELCTALDKESYSYLEEFFIDHYNTLAPNGYNLKRGGNNGTFSEVSKERCRIAQKENWEVEGRREYYSEIVKEQWATNPELAEKRIAPIREYIDNKRIPVIEVCMSTGNITKYPSYNHTRYPSDIKSAVDLNSYAHNSLWYKDLGETDSIITTRALEKLRRWQPENIYPIIAESLDTGKCVEYANIQEAKEAGFDISSIRKCLEGILRQTGGYRWQLKSEFKPQGATKLPKTNGRPIIATNLQTGEVKEFITALEAKAQGYHNVSVGRAIKETKPYKGFTWRFK